jgi:hypothetical protein
LALGFRTAPTKKSPDRFQPGLELLLHESRLDPCGSAFLCDPLAVATSHLLGERCTLPVDGC